MPVFYLLINVSFIVVVLSGNLTAVVSVLNTIIMTHSEDGDISPSQQIIHKEVRSTYIVGLPSKI